MHKCVVRVDVLSTPPSVVGKFLPANRNWSYLRKNHEWSDREEPQEFQLLVVHLFRYQFVDEDDGDEGDRFLRGGFLNLQPVRGSTA